jgi:triosephosphate isomerase
MPAEAPVIRARWPRHSKFALMSWINCRREGRRLSCAPLGVESDMRRPLIAGNWKMHGSLAATRALVSAIEASGPFASAEVAVMPPFPYLATALSLAFTGEVAPAMLREIGCRYVILGHSERRQYHAESDALVAAKFKAAQAAGLVPIVCVGETLAQRDAGDTDAVVSAQLGAVLDAAGVEAFANAVVAYEPVWAIGTGRTATPEQAQAVHALLRGIVAARSATIAGSLRILYGGSVKPGNAATLFAQADIDGGLIGGASLVADDFVAIIRAAAH